MAYNNVQPLNNGLSSLNNIHFHFPTSDITSASGIGSISYETTHIKEETMLCKKYGKIENDDHLIVFIHGYKNNENDANKRGLAIDAKLGTKKVITTGFNWKSFNQLTKYKGDQETAKNCAKHFVQYIENLRNDGQFSKIDIIAHSMGNYLLSEAILNCDRNNKLNLFKGCNVICLAADVEIEQYHNTINKAKHYVQSWIHYYNDLDVALFASNIANISIRAGQCKCKHNFVKSIQWLTLTNSHGYIDDIFDDDTELAPHILNQLKLKPKDKGIEMKVDNNNKDLSHLSAVYQLLMDGDGCGSGDVYWIEIEAYNDKLYGTLKLQTHKSRNMVVGFVRTYGFWSNHNDKYRIILNSDHFNDKNNKNVDNEWKEIYHSSNLRDIKNKYTECCQVFEWIKHS